MTGHGNSPSLIRLVHTAWCTSPLVLICGHIMDTKQRSAIQQTMSHACPYERMYSTHPSKANNSLPNFKSQANANVRETRDTAKRSSSRRQRQFLADRIHVHIDSAFIHSYCNNTWLSNKASSAAPTHGIRATEYEKRCLQLCIFTLSFASCHLPVFIFKTVFSSLNLRRNFESFFCILYSHFIVCCISQQSYYWCRFFDNFNLKVDLKNR